MNFLRRWPKASNTTANVNKNCQVSQNEKLPKDFLDFIFMILISVMSKNLCKICSQDLRRFSGIRMCLQVQNNTFYVRSRMCRIFRSLSALIKANLVTTSALTHYRKRQVAHGMRSALPDAQGHFRPNFGQTAKKCHYVSFAFHSCFQHSRSFKSKCILKS